ncbi:hypothetical protein E5093_00640 [Acinetobacter indicus]|uniref:hypothetical protein n=1 Tax=Acinetobacter indicus TaxID=756892 RepID=UPI00159F46AC|nr:hypothetical protein [Acinetobacter indicus]QLB58194.1 hypothetical protein E5093_00640 [Acinetobacter indicus]
MSELKDTKEIFAEALRVVEFQKETPLRQLTRKILNEERKYLYSEQGVYQRRKNIRTFIDEARNSGDFQIGENK